MATNINVLKRERLDVFKALKRSMRRLDTIQEAAERKINNVLRRRSYAPTAEDYEEVMTLLQQTGGAHQDIVNVLESGRGVF